MDRPAPRRRADWYEHAGKRPLDVLLASASLLLLSPVFAIVALVVRVRIGSPVLFRQQRAGLNGTPFVLVKFRTMREDRDRTGQLLPDRDRLSRLGRFLRRFSLDELPGLVNVLRGDLSLVGPRPLPLSYVDRYSPAQARRLEVKPGVTGLAQVRGRNALSWDEKFALDVWYVEHQCFRLDLTILFLTLAVVATGHGVSQPGHATMEEFGGTSR